MVILEEPIKEVLFLRNYIGGEPVDSERELIDVINPATMKILAKAPNSTRDEINAAVESAKEAFPEWRRTLRLLGRDVFLGLRNLWRSASRN